MGNGGYVDYLRQWVAWQAKSDRDRRPKREFAVPPFHRITLTITESRRLIYHFKNGMFATSVHCFVRRPFWMVGVVSETRQFNELRKWLASEMQDEAQASGMVNRSDNTRMRAMAKAVAYNRVMQKMDEIEAASAKAEVDSIPSIRDMWVAENGIE
jgi:hypothetical protein